MSKVKKPEFNGVKQIKQTSLADKKLIAEIFQNKNFELQINFLGDRKELIKLLSYTIKQLGNESN